MRELPMFFTALDPISWLNYVKQNTYCCPCITMVMVLVMPSAGLPLHFEAVKRLGMK